jgi:hypothetical protein
MTTPVVMIAASNLTSNIGLQPNTAMISVMNAVTSNSLVSNYANLQPGTAYATTLSGRGFSVVNLMLPEFIANANTTIVSAQIQYNKMLPSNGDGTYNIPKFASLLSAASSFASTSWKMNNTLENFNGINFSDIGISVSDYNSVVTNGLSNIFGNQTSINILSSALRNLGTAFDITQIGKLNDLTVFINNLQKQGLLPVGFITSANSDNLLNALSMISGAALKSIISQTKIVLPEPLAVTNLAQLLELPMIFPPRAVAVVPGGTLAGLANELLNFGGRFNSFAELATVIASIEVPSIPYLNAYTSLIPNSDYTRLTAKLGSGSGPYTNPLITDLLGTVAGVRVTDNLTTVSSALTSVLTYSSATALSTALVNLAAACDTANNTFIDSNIAATRTAANTFTVFCNSNVTLSSTVISANTAIKSLQSHLSLELDNLLLADANIDAASPTGVNSTLGMVNSLHDYGVDTYQLGYNTLFNNCLQLNVGGDAIKAAMIEGRNINNQNQRSVLITTRYVARPEQ